MTFETYFEKARRRLRGDLETFMASKRGDVAHLRPWGVDALRRLKAGEGRAGSGGARP